MKDEMCNDIERLGLTAPRVTPEAINELMSRLKFNVYVVPGTNTTQACAIYNGFVLVTGETSCVSKENFNAELGAKYAIDNAKTLAWDKLWELEGWRLKRELECTIEDI